MKIWFKQLAYTSLAILGLALIASPLYYKNVVTGIPANRDAGVAAKSALGNIASATNKDSALRAAVNLLPGEGTSLETKIAKWISYDIKKVDSMKFFLVSGDLITATSADKKLHEGFVRDQIVVRIFSGTNPPTDFFVRCANGYVSERSKKLVTKTPIGANHVVDHSTTVTIPQGGSLCGTLGMNGEEALEFANANNLKPFWKKGRLFAWVFPGDQFRNSGGVWTKL